MKVKGRVHRFGVNVNTDAIIPARYLHIVDVNELSKHCMEDIDKEFVNNLEQGDIIVADANFGCGSSRQHAPIAIKTSGVGCVIAKSFGRIFYRNALNIGLPILESEQAVDGITDGNIVEADLVSGEIVNLSNRKVFQAKAYPDFMLELISAGGLVEYTRRRLLSGDL
jgi:3-isopropylmalate/(R)-2-methylmalate dehydratase small subunit